MAYNIQLAQRLTQSTDALFSGVKKRGVSSIATGTKVFSLSSQILEKTQMYLSGAWNDPELKRKRGINGFLMDVVKETVVDLQSEITDYPLETEDRIQSHYSKHPVKIRVSGVCSDIRVHDPNDQWGIENILDDITEMSEKLTMISGALGVGKAVKYGSRVTSFMNTTHVLYRKLKESANMLSKVYNRFKGIEDPNEPKTSQINAFEQLENMWSTGALLNVETPYKVYDNCVIENLSFTQPEDTLQQTMIEVTFKQLTLNTAAVGFHKAITDEKTFTQLAQAEKKNNPNGNSSDSFLVGSFVEGYNKDVKSGKEGTSKQRATQEYMQNNKLKSTKQISASML